MSAFVVDQEHIDELVSAAIDLEIRARLVTDRGCRQVNHENASDFGRLLWAENVRSVIHRYRLSGTEEAAEYEAAVEAYRFTWRPVPPGRAAGALLGQQVRRRRLVPGHGAGPSRKINVNAICPGVLATEMWNVIDLGPGRRCQSCAVHTPLDRQGGPDQVPFQ